MRNVIGYLLGFIGFIVCIPLIMWLASGLPDLSGKPLVQIVVSGILIIAGPLLSVYTEVYMYRIGHGNPFDPFNHPIGNQTSNLMTDGPYRICRNPMLLGMFIYTLGALIYIFTWQALVVYILMVVVMSFQVRSEEKRLLADFGEDYKQYCSKTLRFLPNFLAKKN